jgi:hypothetical protein
MQRTLVIKRVLWKAIYSTCRHVPDDTPNLSRTTSKSARKTYYLVAGGSYKGNEVWFESVVRE